MTTWGPSPMPHPIYYINLASRPDRRTFMERQLNNLGLEGRRVEAITPADISAATIAQLCDRNQRFYRRENELACTLSHKKAWREILEGGHDQAVVLEDDALLSSRLPAFLASLENLPFDILRFEAASRRIRVLPVTTTLESGIRIRPFRSTPFGSSGYVVTAQAIRRMIDHPNVGRLPIDVALYGTFSEPGQSLRRYHTDPALCIQLGNQPEAGDVAKNDMDDSGEIHRYAIDHPVRYAAEKTVSGILHGLRNAVDHVAHLPRGLRSEKIPFAHD